MTEATYHKSFSHTFNCITHHWEMPDTYEANALTVAEFRAAWEKARKLNPEVVEPNIDPSRGIYSLVIDGKEYKLQFRRERLTRRTKPEDRGTYDLKDEKLGWFKASVTRRLVGKRVRVEVSAWKYENRNA